MSLSLRWEGVPKRSATRPTRTAERAPQGAPITSAPTQEWPRGTGAQACPRGHDTGGGEGRRTRPREVWRRSLRHPVISRSKQSCSVVVLQDPENTWASPAGLDGSRQGSGLPPEPAMKRGRRESCDAFSGHGLKRHMNISAGSWGSPGQPHPAHGHGFQDAGPQAETGLGREGSGSDMQPVHSRSTNMERQRPFWGVPRALRGLGPGDVAPTLLQAGLCASRSKGLLRGERNSG